MDGNMIDYLADKGADDAIIVQDPRMDKVIEEVRGANSVLDVGCVRHDADEESNGRWLHRELAEIVTDLVGLDYLAEEVEKLNKRGYNVIHENAEDFSINYTFDAIVAGELIEHLANPGSFLSCARDHLRDNGQLILTTPNPWYIRRFAEALSGYVRCNPEHTCWFDERTLHQLLERFGFDVTAIHYAPKPRFSPWYALSNLESYATTPLYRIGPHLLGGNSLVIVATKKCSK